MQVIGTTSEREAYIASSSRRFRLNELLIIEDESQGMPVAEVMETGTLNPLLPQVTENSPFLLEGDALAALTALGYDPSRETVYVGKVRLLDELFYPVPAGARVRVPRFDEVKKILLPTSPEHGSVWGVIRGTESLSSSLPEGLRDLAPLWDGEQLIPQEGVPLVFDYRAMQDYPHIGIFGGSGSGKSFGLRVIIEEFLEHQIPMLILDPHYEMSFSTPLSDRMPPGFAQTYGDRVDILAVGRDIGVDFEEATDSEITSLLDAVSPLSEAMEAAVRAIMRKGDSLKSFQIKLDILIDMLEGGETDCQEAFRQLRGTKEEPGKEDIQRLKKMVSQIGNAATLRAIRWRLGRLTGEGIFLKEGARRVEEGIRSGRSVVVRGSLYMLRVYAAYVLRKLYQKRRDYRDALQRGTAGEPFPPFLVITDEAHNFAPRGDNNTPSRREIREIAQEGRKYGVFLVLATQRPALLDETVNAQLNSKLIFRTVRSTDLNVIKEETDLSVQDVHRLPYVQSGNCFLSSPVFGRTIAMRFRAARTKSPHGENPFDELEGMRRRESGTVLEVLAENAPFQDVDFPRLIAKLEMRGIKMSMVKFEETLKDLCKQGLVKVEEGFVRRYRL